MYTHIDTGKEFTNEEMEKVLNEALANVFQNLRGKFVKNPKKITILPYQCSFGTKHENEGCYCWKKKHLPSLRA